MQAKGGLIPRARYKFEGNIAAKHRAKLIGNTSGSFAYQQPANLSMDLRSTGFYYRALSNLKSRARRGAVKTHLPKNSERSIRLATCLDRSAAASGAIARWYRPAFHGASSCHRRSAWRCSRLLPPAERLPPAGRAPGAVKRPVGRLIGPERPVEGP